MFQRLIVGIFIISIMDRKPQVKGLNPQIIFITF